MPEHEQILNLINENILVTRPQIVAAKEFILGKLEQNRQFSTNSLLQEFLVSIDATPPEKVVIHPTIDPMPLIKQAAQNISWSQAFSEAIWSLVHKNILLQINENLSIMNPHIEWTTGIPGSGGTSSGWSFKNWKYSFPQQLMIAPSLIPEMRDYLTDPDIFLKHLNIERLHPKIKESIEEAILCFRAELYTPCLAMLMRAVEGAWLELGLSLLKVLENEQQSDFIDQNYEILTDDFSSAAKIIHTVQQIYERQDFFRKVAKLSGVKLKDLRFAVVWADCVRESRNVVHYRNEPHLPNDFEKVATLILGIPAHFKLIYNLRNICEDLVVEDS